MRAGRREGAASFAARPFVTIDLATHRLRVIDGATLGTSFDVVLNAGAREFVVRDVGGDSLPDVVLAIPGAGVAMLHGPALNTS